MYVCFNKYQYTIILVLFLRCIPDLKLLYPIMVLMPQEWYGSVRFYSYYDSTCCVRRNTSTSQVSL